MLQDTFILTENCRVKVVKFVILVTSWLLILMMYYHITEREKVLFDMGMCWEAKYHKNNLQPKQFLHFQLTDSQSLQTCCIMYELFWPRDDLVMKTKFSISAVPFVMTIYDFHWTKKFFLILITSLLTEILD